MSDAYQIETWGDLSTAERHAEEWQCLWRSCPSATVFQTPGWLLAWARHLGRRANMRFIAVRHRGLLLGLAPLVVQGCRGERDQVSLLGEGVSDYLDVLANPKAPRVADILLDEMLGLGVCKLGPLHPESLLLQACSSHNIRRTITAPQVCPVLLLSNSAKKPEDVVPPSFGKRLVRAHRLAQKLGNFESRHADLDTLDGFLEQLFVLHASRWALCNQWGVLGSTAIQDFHRQAARALYQEGLLRLLEVRLQGCPAASLLAFVTHGRLHCYVSGFDPRFARYSPGRLALRAALARALDEGLTEIDFLRGNEPYKYDWGARDRPVFCLQVERAQGGP